MPRETLVYDPITGTVVPKSQRTPPPPTAAADLHALQMTAPPKRGRYIWNGKAWQLAASYYRSRARRGRGDGLQVVRDIDPYRSTVTGEVVGGRRQHRDHLKAHNCVEYGNEMPGPKPLSAADQARERQDRVDAIKRAVEQGPSPEMRARIEQAQNAPRREGWRGW